MKMKMSFLKKQEYAEISVREYLDAKYDTRTASQDLRKLEKKAIQSLEYLVDSATKKYRTSPGYQDSRQAAWEEIIHRLETYQQSKCGAFTYWAMLGVNREAYREFFYAKREQRMVMPVSDELQNEKDPKHYSRITIEDKDIDLTPLEITILKQNLNRLNEEETKILSSYLNSTGSLRETACELGYGDSSWTRKLLADKFAHIVRKIKIY